MNTCLNPPKHGSKAASTSGIPGFGGDLPTGNESIAEILAMMKKQGVDVSGFEAEAEDIWRSLNDMSERDPDEYRNFIASQMEDMKANATPSSSSAIPTSMPKMVPGVKPSTSSSSSSSTSASSGVGAGTGAGVGASGGGAAQEEEKFFRPKAGFSVTTKTTSGDGLKVRMEGQGKTLFINFCQHGEEMGVCVGLCLRGSCIPCLSLVLSFV